LFSKTEAQWAQGQSAALVLQQLLHKSYEVQGDAVQKQAVKALCLLLKNRKIGGLEVVHKVLKEFVDQKLTQTMQSTQVNVSSGGAFGQLEGQAQKEAMRILGLLSGVVQLVPIELCQAFTPKILVFSEI